MDYLRLQSIIKFYQEKSACIIDVKEYCKENQALPISTPVTFCFPLFSSFFTFSIEKEDKNWYGRLVLLCSSP